MVEQPEHHAEKISAQVTTFGKKGAAKMRALFFCGLI
jgi:hypothetical protein